ncbi:helix-turn-helix domain-containing protein [Pedobacter antarcticus]|uniref:helix-turn-helix domain-containing protein n=1 Tax=Pedobacter antarcticus TaxID=34086 RepID=UPI001C580B39|nr:helix-turn-helix transcriptional regulator [Pedobacter antarcticus]
MQEILSKKLLGNRIKSLRLEKAYAQSEVAAILNLSRSNYSQIELGNQYPSYNTLQAISLHYQKSYTWLLHGTSSPSVQSSEAAVIKELQDTLHDFSFNLKRLEKQLLQIRIKLGITD